MQIRIRKTEQVMYEDEFRTYIKNNNGPTWEYTSEGILNNLGADVVFEGPQATGGTHYQYSMRDGVEQIDGKFFTKYILGPVFTDGETTAVEQETAYKLLKDTEQANALRNSRNEKLKQSDWTQVDDAPVNKTAWAAYRQALRDIPNQAGFPWTITWPVTP